jgi:asparagine synthetase B (glutamine-hydrolysing)
MPDGITLYAGVRRLQLGQAVALREGGWEPFTMWSAVYRPPLDVDREEAMALIRDEVRRAVRQRLAPGGETAVLLSGGFDSGMLSGVASPILRERGEELLAYSAVFPGEPYDESPSIDALTSELGLVSTRLRVHPQGTLTRALRYQRRWQMPQPGPGSILDQPLVQRAVADGATVMLDGQGGDEIFAASPVLMADYLRGLRLVRAYRLLHRYQNMGERLEARRVRSVLSRWGVRGMLPYAFNRRMAEHRMRAAGGPPEAAWLSEEALRHHIPIDMAAWKAAFDGPRWWAYLADSFTIAREESGMEDYLRRRAHLDGLESRSPLMADVDLSELMLRMPPEFAFDRRSDRALGREAMKGIVPDAARLPPPAKSNYASLMHLTLTGADQAGLRALLQRPDAEVRAYLQPGVLERHFEKVPTALTDPGWTGWGLRTWALATTELWLQSQKGEESLSRLEADLPLAEPGTDVIAAGRP